MKKTDKALQVTKQQIDAVEQILKNMRSEFNRTTHPQAVLKLAQEIDTAVAKLESLKRLYGSLGGGEDDGRRSLLLRINTHNWNAEPDDAHAMNERLELLRDLTKLPLVVLQEIIDNLLTVTKDRVVIHLQEFLK